MLVCVSSAAFLNDPKPAVTTSTILIGGFDTQDIYDMVEIVTETGVCNHKIPPFPVVKSGMAAALYNGQEDLLVCGGENRGPWSNNFHACYSFFRAQNRWLEAEPTIYPRSNAMAHAIRNFVVMFGGVTGGLEDDWNKVERASFGYQKWEVIPDWSLPHDLTDPCSVVVDNRYIHLMGCTSIGCETNEPLHLRLDVESTLGWELMPSMKEVRKAFGCVATSEGILVTGGEGYQDGKNHYLDTVEFFNLGTEEWEMLAPLDTPRSHHTMGLVGEEVPTIFGGALGSNITGDVLIYQDGSWTDAGFSLNREKLQGGSTVGYQSSWNCI